MSQTRKKQTTDTVEEYLQQINELTDKILGYSSSEGPNWNIETCCLQALSNIFITPREVIITADLPNIKPETLKVDVLDEKLIEITAKMKEKVRFADLGICHRQGEFSFLRCQYRLDVAVAIERMKFSCEKGILEVRLPRKKNQTLR
jgi:HSP20 family molecular chaperone IbpA